MPLFKQPQLAQINGKGAGPFYFPDGKARLNVTAYVGPAEDVDEEFPIILTTGRVVSQFLSGNQTRRIGPLVDHCPEPRIEMHPRLATRLGITDGDWATAESRRGNCTLRASVVTTIRPDTVFIPYHWAGRKSANQLTISGGGEVKASTLDTLIGAEPGADGNKILVTGANSKLTLYTGVLRTLYVGRSGNSNTLEILAGGQVASGNVRIGGGTGATGSPTGNGVLVDGGSTWTIAGTMRVGAGVAGTNSGLDITNGGVVTVTGNSFVGYDAVNDDNHVLVSGPGSQLNVQALTISRVVGAANNTVTVANGGTLSAASITLGAATGTSVGGLEIGAGGPAGVIAPTTITGVGSDPTVRFNHTSAGHAFAPALSGTLALVHDGAGSTELGGAGTYTGPTTVNAGALRLNGVSGTNAIAVNAGGTLGVAAGAVATTPGAYVQAAGGTYEVNIANAATYGALQVDGAATLPPSAPIFVRANCGATAPGATFPGVMTSSNPIAVAGFTVTDNCPNLAFTASLRGDGLAIDLVARADGTAAIPVLSGGGAAALAGLLALSSILVLRRRTRPEVRRGRS